MKSRLIRQWILPLAVIAAVTVSLLASWSSVPSRWVPTAVSGLTLLFLAYSWNIVGGIIGELAFAHMVFWAIGAYGYILMARSEQGFTLTFALVVLLAAIFSWLLVNIGTALGLEGLYLTTFTLIVFEFVKAVVIGTKSIGGNEGLLFFNLEDDTAVTAGYYFLVLVMVAFWINSMVLSGSLGRKWLAVKDDEVAAKASGVFSKREKTIAYVLSGGLTSLGGAVQAYYLGYAQPDTSLGIGLLISAVIAVYIGGPGTRFGPLLGVIVIYSLDAVARNRSTSIQVSLYAQLFQYSVAILIFWLLSLKKLQGFNLAGLFRFLRRKASSASDAGSSSSAEKALATGSGKETERSRKLGSEILKISNVAKNFGGASVLRDVSFTLREGEILGLIGPNGAGKTTLCNIITGVYTADKGTVQLKGEEISKLSTPQRFRRGLGRTFQAARVFQSLTIRDNVLLATPRDPERVEELLAKFGLDGSRPTQGAEMFIRRLTEIARAIAQPKSVLIFDEPLAGLTPTQHHLVLESIKEVAATGTAVIIIEHLIPTVAPVCDRMIVLHNGALIADGPSAQVLNDEAVVGAYLGKSIGSEE